MRVTRQRWMLSAACKLILCSDRSCSGDSINPVVNALRSQLVSLGCRALAGQAAGRGLAAREPGLCNNTQFGVDGMIARLARLY